MSPDHGHYTQQWIQDNHTQQWIQDLGEIRRYRQDWGLLDSFPPKWGSREGPLKEPFQTQQKSKIGAKSRRWMGELAPQKEMWEKPDAPRGSNNKQCSSDSFPVCFMLSLLCLTVPMVCLSQEYVLEWQTPRYAGLETVSRFLVWSPFCNVCRCFWVPISVVSSGEIALFLCNATPEMNCCQPLHIPEQDEVIFI